MKLSESNILECVVCLILIGVNHSAVDAKGFDRLGNAKDDKRKFKFKRNPFAHSTIKHKLIGVQRRCREEDKTQKYFNDEVNLHRR